MSKSSNILDLYIRFLNGESLSKTDIRTMYKLSSDRSAQRYVSELNQFFSETHERQHQTISIKNKKYVMRSSTNEMFNKEKVLAILKMLISVRGLDKSEIEVVVHSLTYNLSDEDKNTIYKTIQSELVHYTPLTNSGPIFEKLWALNEHINQKDSLKIEYANARNELRIHSIRPIFVTFSEFYFYLVGRNTNGDTLIFRVDRIEGFEVEKNVANFEKAYSEGELKRRIYFMYGGKMERVTFEFNGGVIESVLDRFPTAKLVKKDYKHNRFTVEIEVIGEGIIMWLLSQGSKVIVHGSKRIKEQYEKEVERMYRSVFFND